VNEIIDNCIDEYIMGDPHFAKQTPKVEKLLKLSADNGFTVLKRVLYGFLRKTYFGNFEAFDTFIQLTHLAFYAAHYRASLFLAIDLNTVF
jgi:hypothetical protein